MKAPKWLKSLFREAVQEEVREVVQEEKKLREAAPTIGVTIDADEDNWRPLTGDTKRDLSPVSHQRMRDMALYLWESNLLANRLIELPLAYILAEGVSLRCKNEDNQKTLTRFWKDPINQMDIKLVKKVRELAIYGEQCYPTFINEHSGHVRLGYLDPALIETVVIDPDNPEQPIGIVTTKDRKGVARRYRVIVNGPDDELFTKRTQEIRATFDDGEAFYFTINDLSNGRRGRSDLLAQIDWLDGYDQFLFGELDRSSFLRAFLWDVTLKGATPEEVKKRASEITAPNPASVRVHNEGEEWNAVSPNLGAADSEGSARLFRNHVLGGSTVPEHWFGGGGNVNRATAGEMGDPTFKMFSMRQKFLKYVLETIGFYVLRQNELAANRGEPDAEDTDFAVEAEFPELTSRDTAKYAQALQQVIAAAALAVTNKFISIKTAIRLINSISERLGVEIDAETELNSALDEAGKKSEKDAFTAAGAAAGDTASGEVK
jgi:hypothetical protein